MGAAIIPLSTSLATSGLSAVRSAVDHVVTSVVGVFDPGKARDADREARAEMWYQLARQGSVYAGRHVLGGRTLVYTVKEKADYETRWAELLTSAPTIAQQAQVLGGLGIPDNPTDAEKTQMANEISAYTAAMFPAPASGAYLTPSGTPGVAPVAQVSPQVHPAVIPTQATATTTLPAGKMWLYVALVVAGMLALVYVVKRKG